MLFSVSQLASTDCSQLIDNKLATLRALTQSENILLLRSRKFHESLQ